MSIIERMKELIDGVQAERKIRYEAENTKQVDQPKTDMEKLNAVLHSFVKEGVMTSSEAQKHLDLFAKYVSAGGKTVYYRDYLDEIKAEHPKLYIFPYYFKNQVEMELSQSGHCVKLLLADGVFSYMPDAEVCLNKILESYEGYYNDHVKRADAFELEHKEVIDLYNKVKAGKEALEDLESMRGRENDARVSYDAVKRYIASMGVINGFNEHE